MPIELPQLREAVLDALAVLLPVDCAGCGRADRALCLACRATFGAAKEPLVHTIAGVPIVSALHYDGAVRQAILAFKELGRTDIARALAEPLARAIELAAIPRDAADAPLELCTIPPSRTAWRRRGYDPVSVLLRAARLRPARGVLRARHRASVSAQHEQKLLDRSARSLNREGTLTAVRPLSGRRFIIVDDVLTTGATLTEAIRAVREAGGIVEAGATLAFTPKRFPTLGERS